MQDEIAFKIAERYTDYYYEKVQEENRRKNIRIQKSKELREKKVRVILLSLVLVIMILMCMAMIQTEMRVRSQSQHVAYLQTKLSNQLAENEDMKRRMINSADYHWIEQEAMKLGMSYPTPDNVIYYDAPTQDYMLQTEEIPKS